MNELPLHHALKIATKILEGDSLYVIRRTEKEGDIIRDLVSAILDLGNIDFEVVSREIKTAHGQVIFINDNSQNATILSTLEGEI